MVNKMNELHKYERWKGNKAGYTATEVACGRAGEVIIKANSSVWAGAVLQNCP